MSGIVIGGGIGGLCLATALQRVGLSVRVYESAPAFEPVGAGITLAPNAMQLLANLDVAGAVRASGISLGRMVVSDYRGHELQVMDGKVVERRYGHPMIAIHRADLHRALLDRLDDGVLFAGKRCLSCRETAEQVIVEFDDGSEERGEYLVGADGLRSAVRQALFPSAELRYSGQTCWRGVVNASMPSDIANTSDELWGPGRRFGYLPIGRDRIYWYAANVCAAGGVDDGDVRSSLIDIYRDFADPVRSLLAETAPSTIVRHDLHYLQPMSQWSRGRIGLLGDAAHATTPDLGQGGAQAIEDGWVLARELSSEDDPAAAFRRYTAHRRRKANRIIRESRRFGRIASLQSPVLCGLRNVLIRCAPAWVNHYYTAWMFRGPEV